MINTILHMIRSLFAQPQQVELLIPVRVDEKRKLPNRR